VAFVATAACVLGFGTVPAWAYTAAYTAPADVSCATIKGHYLYDNSSLRADGYWVQLKPGCGYIRSVTTTEFLNGSQFDARTLTFTGTATFSNITGISENLLGWMPRPGYQQLAMEVDVVTTNATTFKKWIFTPIA
jgi:hypothetical protein